jgi:hypothetical protein
MTEIGGDDDFTVVRPNDANALTSATVSLMTVTVENLKRTLEDVQNYRKRNFVIFSIVGVVIIALLSFVVVVAVQNRSVTAEVKRNADSIAQCTTPGTECFNKTQEQLNQRIAFGIQDTLKHNGISVDFLVTCLDPNSHSLCAQQFDAKLAKIVHDAVIAAQKGTP